MSDLAKLAAKIKGTGLSPAERRWLGYVVDAAEYAADEPADTSSELVRDGALTAVIELLDRIENVPTLVHLLMNGSDDSAVERGVEWHGKIIEGLCRIEAGLAAPSKGRQGPPARTDDLRMVCKVAIRFLEGLTGKRFEPRWVKGERHTPKDDATAFVYEVARAIYPEERLKSVRKVLENRV